jgi:hypothetical protein
VAKCTAPPPPKNTHSTGLSRKKVIIAALDDESRYNTNESYN